jgi:ribosomal protein L7/L12
MPATVLVGDGRTPAFQAYLTPCFQHGALARLIEEASSGRDEDIRKSKLKAPKNRQPASISGLSNTKNWTAAQLKARYEQVRGGLDWANTMGSAKEWWLAFEAQNTGKMPLMVRMVEELAIRKSSISEFFDAFCESKVSDIQANLSYLDYRRIKNQENEKKFPVEDLQDSPPVLVDEPKKGFEVYLTTPGLMKTSVIGIVKRATGKSLVATKRLVESSPVSLGWSSSRTEADRIVREIRALGGIAQTFASIP